MKKQKTFKDCLSPIGGKLRFDFYVNNSFLLEFDGPQHFNCDKGGWSTPEQLQKTKEYDKIKNQYCLINNIPLKRIPYWALNNLTLEDIIGNKYLV